MIIDGKELPADMALDFDICIAGAGAAGIALGLEFDGSDKKICILESGGLCLDVATQDLYSGEVRGWPYWPLASSRIRFFGGTTNHWGGACIPMNPDDFEHRSWVENSGWPIAIGDLLEPYQRACKLFGLNHVHFDGGELLDSRKISDDLTEHFKIGMSQIAKIKRFGIEYRETLAKSINVSVILNSNLVGFGLSPMRNIVESCAVQCLSGKQFKVRASLFVLALGGIENARMLLSSSSGNSTGLGNKQDLVGRYFSDHPYFGGLAKLQIWDPTISLGSLAESRIRDGASTDFHLELPLSVRSRHKLLTTRIHLNQSSWEWYLNDYGKPPSTALEKIQDKLGQRLNKIFDELFSKDPVKPRGPLDFGLPQGAKLYTLGAWQEVVPRQDSRITLSEERDALGIRKPILNWIVGEEEKASLMKSLELLGQYFAVKGVGRIRIDLDEDSPWPWQVRYEPGLHQMGTTRMGSNEQTGVVDPTCKLFDVDNLYVAGSSVFSTYGVANPTLTIIALAIRLADHLKRMLAK